MVGYGANRGIVPISCAEIFRRYPKAYFTGNGLDMGCYGGDVFLNGSVCTFDISFLFRYEIIRNA